LGWGTADGIVILALQSVGEIRNHRGADHGHHPTGDISNDEADQTIAEDQSRNSRDHGPSETKNQDSPHFQFVVASRMAAAFAGINGFVP